MGTPTNIHLATAYRILRYIKFAPRQGILLPSSSQIQLKSFCDWLPALTLEDQSQVIVYFLETLISWKSKKQSVVSRSSVEAEYHSMASTRSELTWL